MDEGVLHDFFAEAGEFFLGWQFSPKDEIGNLEEGALLGQDFDGVAAVFEDSSISVDEGDGGGAGDGVHVAGIIASQDLSFVGQL